MSGLANVASALGDTGVMLKSKRDYEQEISRFEAEKAQSAENLTSTRQRNAIGSDAATELARQRAGEADDRAATQDYISRSSPGFQQPSSAAPIPADAGTAVPAEQTPVAEAPPREQPMPASAIPGSTLSSTPPEAPVGPAAANPLPGGGGSMTAPPRMASPAPAAPTAAPAPQGGGRAGLLDVLGEKALARGDRARYEQLMAQKITLEKEGFAQVAHEALLDPKNVRAIENVFNQNGSKRMVPGSLTYQGKGVYSGSFMNPDGSVHPFNGLNMLAAAMSLGVIAPPKLTHMPATDNAFVQGPDGSITQVAEGHKFATTMNRLGDSITTNLITGEVAMRKADGSEGRINPQDAAGIRQIVTVVGRVGKERSDQIPGKEGNLPTINQPAVMSTAQSIFLNNPDMAKKGLNPGKAAEIAIAINDKDQSAKVGTAMRNGEMWNIVQYGKGKDAQVYGVSRSAQQPAAQAAPAVAPTPRPAPVAPTPRPAPAPQATLPRPPAYPSYPSQGEFAVPETPMQRVVASFNSSTKKQIDFYKQKISGGVLNVHDQISVRALAKGNPGAFTADELKAAGIR